MFSLHVRLHIECPLSMKPGSLQFYHGLPLQGLHTTKHFAGDRYVSWYPSQNPNRGTSMYPPLSDG